MALDFRLHLEFFLLYLLVIEAVSQGGVTKNDLGELYRAFVTDLAYFDREYKNLDSDAVLGLRVAEGYTRRILEDAERGNLKLQLNVYNNVTDILDRVSRVLKKILPLVQANDPLFYRALNSQWTFYKPYQFREQKDIAGENSDIKPHDEGRYSSCVRDIVGTKDREPCTISEECKAAMMTKGARKSLLYYQAMFFILGEVSGCLNKITSKMHISQVELSDHLHEVCLASYYSVGYMTLHGEGDAESIITTLKLSFGCGLLGYHQVLEELGLSNAIWWQLRSGCYGDYSKMGEPLSDGIRKYGKVDGELKSTYLGDGCFSDVTGVGLGVLALFLRWVLDPPPQVQPIELIKDAKEDAQTVSVYMFALFLLSAVFCFVMRKRILEMASTCCAILCGRRRK